MKIKASDFIVDGKINVEGLKAAFESIVSEAVGSNKDNKAAARRFRVQTNALTTAFKEVRKITPQKD